LKIFIFIFIFIFLKKVKILEPTSLEIEKIHVENNLEMVKCFLGEVQIQVDPP
jgi:hypothetical protein